MTGTSYNRTDQARRAADDRSRFRRRRHRQAGDHLGASRGASVGRMVRDLAYEGGLIEAAGGSIHDIPDLHQREGMLGLRDQMMLQALARHAIVEWQGVADEDGATIAPSPAAVDALIRDHPTIAARFDAEYLRELTEMYAEGNGSGVAPTGTSAAAPATADTAPN